MYGVVGMSSAAAWRRRCCCSSVKGSAIGEDVTAAVRLGDGADPAITGEPSEEQLIQLSRAERVGPSSPAVERRTLVCASGVVPRRSRTGATSSPCLKQPGHRRPRSTVTEYPKPAAGQPKFPALETEVLDYWDTDDTFRASVARRDGAPEYVFYDGPPFANGLPHYGHLLTGYVKDIVPRYRTMRGYKVERRFGWDTHGLPAELEVQRQLGISDKAQIEEMGIEKFNEACRASVLKYTNEWRAYVTRQARWVDFDNDYKTLDPTFMRSVY